MGLLAPPSRTEFVESSSWLTERLCPEPATADWAAHDVDV